MRPQAAAGERSTSAAGAASVGRRSRRRGCVAERSHAPPEGLLDVIFASADRRTMSSASRSARWLNSRVERCFSTDSATEAAGRLLIDRHGVDRLLARNQSSPIGVTFVSRRDCSPRLLARA